MNKEYSKYREFSSPQEADEWARSIYSINILNEDEKVAFRNYTGTYYRNMNRYKRGVENVSIAPSAEKWCDKTIPSVILNAPRVPEDIVVYRKITLEVIRSYLKNKRFVEKSFMSTSLLCDKAIESTPCDDDWCILKIYVPKGTPAFYCSVVNNLNENELLIKDNSVLYFEKKSYIRHDVYGKIQLFDCRLELYSKSKFVPKVYSTNLQYL